jgi:hypothetical protein
VNFWWHRLTLILTLTLPAITSSPLMLPFRILSHPHYLSSLWTPTCLCLLFAIQPLILWVPTHHPIFHPGLCLWLPRHPIFTFLTMPLPGLPFLALPPTPTAWGWPIFKPNLLSSLHILYHTPHSLCSLWLSCLRLQIKTIIFQWCIIGLWSYDMIIIFRYIT